MVVVPSVKGSPPDKQGVVRVIYTVSASPMSHSDKTNTSYSVFGSRPEIMQLVPVTDCVIQFPMPASE